MDEAIKYIHHQKSKHGRKDHEIKAMFESVGWHPHAIEELFTSYHEHRHKLLIVKRKWMQGGMVLLIILFAVLAGIFAWLNWL